ncbi:HDOD domain-containing protein [Dechloromonas sp.]|uniref:HDOD domain-containing protein n=1 Tax=Dechloromonas sp. TaxID=1917218 RepID=UPI0012288E2B|nr:HDOD domain-containing protein [Dechloromonas sp.]MBU3697352.1 HDOD domain-containing protein [Dechloromonas sp.]TEX49077.1 MAG: hypothetical protein CFR70_04010 [Rhodocyclaceae bacterium]
MSLLSREQVAARLKQLPSLPAVVTRLLDSFANEEIDTAAIARQIALDQGLTARVLRVANSSFYRLQSRVGTINEAVVVLGFRAVRSMVLAVGVNSAFRADLCLGFDQAAYLRHGVGTALRARELASAAGHNPELAFTAGILHDIGQLVLAASWRFPPALALAVSGHHAPPADAPGSLAGLVHVADAVAHALGLTGSKNEMVMPVDDDAWRETGVTPAALLASLPRIVAGMDETCQAFSA